MSYRQCTKCVMDTTAKEIVFTRTGVCNFCQEFAKADWERRHQIEHLPALLDKIKQDGRNNKYDCLVGLSGGVDSSTCLNYLVQLGLRPLCFSVDNGWNTVQADENIMRLVEGLKVPFERHALDFDAFKQLQEAFLKSGTINVEIPTDHCLMAKTYELADKYKIKWILSGGNVATEGIMPKSWGYQARDLRFVKAISRTFGNNSLKKLPTTSLMQYLKYRFLRKIKIVNLLDFYEYNREESIQMLSKKFGYKPYGDKHGESMFTWWFQNHYLTTKFNIDKRKAHYSSMINSKQMTRAAAQNLLMQPLTYPQIPQWDKYAKDNNRHDYTEYKNSEWLWTLLSKVYSWRF